MKNEAEVQALLETATGTLTRLIAVGMDGGINDVAGAITEINSSAEMNLVVMLAVGLLTVAIKDLAEEADFTPEEMLALAMDALLAGFLA